MTSSGLLMPPDQKASQTRSILPFNSPVITGTTLTGRRPSPTSHAVLAFASEGAAVGRITLDGGAGPLYDCAVAVVGRGRVIPNRSPSRPWRDGGRGRHRVGRLPRG